MDTITHGLAGSVLTRTLSARPARRAFLLGAIAGMFPDCDFLFTPDRLSYLRNHRGWTHSFIAMPFFALALALIGRLVFRRARLPALWLFCAVAIVSHILLDWVTSFGTMFFVPISRTRDSLDWVFILDPVLTGLAAVSLGAALAWRKGGRKVAAAGGLLLCSYIGFCAVQHRRALAVWRRIDGPISGARIAVLPQFLSPFRWLGLSDRAGEVHAAFFDIGPFARGVPDPRPPERFSEILSSLSDFYPPPQRAVILQFAKPAESRLLAATRALPDVRTYLAFARFPLATVDSQPDGSAAITWEDLRFLPWFSGPWQRDQKNGLRSQPFLYRVRLDAAGRVLDRTFVPTSRFGRRSALAPDLRPSGAPASGSPGCGGGPRPLAWSLARSRSRSARGGGRDFRGRRSVRDRRREISATGAPETPRAATGAEKPVARQVTPAERGRGRAPRRRSIPARVRASGLRRLRRSSPPSQTGERRRRPAASGSAARARIAPLLRRTDRARASRGTGGRSRSRKTRGRRRDAPAGPERWRRRRRSGRWAADPVARPRRRGPSRRRA